MTPASRKKREEPRIRKEIESWAEALRRKDVDALVAHYTPDVVTADLAPPLWNAGVETLRRNFGAWFPTWKGDLDVEIRDLHVTAGSEVAFARSLNRLHGTKTTGEPADLWVRATICFRKIGDDWKVEHEHISVPFHMDGSLRAAVDLKP
jgi:PhnB protein